MKFQTAFLAATTFAATLTAATMAVSPAQAAVLSGTLNLSNVIDGGATFSPTSINFFGPGTFGSGFETGGLLNPNGSGTVITGASSGSFASFIGIGLIKDLTVPSPTAIEKTAFLSLFGTGPGLVSFSLSNFIYNAGNRSATFDGFFSNGGDNTAAFGQFTAQSVNSLTSSYSLSITTGSRSIPTPALLPGLIALGAGVLRKRKGEVAENVGVDA